ncbi:MAG TPA: hypothetical protein VL401_04100 [Alphaproteobacteria bacterium]|jgi:hypothetical protein|nr:hypothetical protein [Alphaproteobacteria bacterium]
MKFRYIIGVFVILVSSALVFKYLKSISYKSSYKSSYEPAIETIVFKDDSFPKATRQTIAGGTQYKPSYSIKVLPGWKIEHSVFSDGADGLYLTTSNGDYLGIVQDDVGGVGCAFAKKDYNNWEVIVNSFVEIRTQDKEILRTGPTKDEPEYVCWKRPIGDWITDSIYGSLDIKIKSSPSDEVKSQIYSMLSSLKKIENGKK